MDNELYNDAEPKNDVRNESYYIPSTYKPEYSPGSMGHLLQCHKCKRKILVSMGLIGTVHHMGTSATCADCLEIDPEFRKQHPDIAHKLDEWKHAKD